MKIAWFKGDVETPEVDWENGHRVEYLSMDEIIALPDSDPRRPFLRVLLVPDDFDLTELTGDDWNDAPANCNAGDPYDRTLPPGAKWLQLYVGDRTASSSGLL